MVVRYDPLLVMTSVLVAVFASYTALGISITVAHAIGRTRLIWLALGSIAMGVGIWSMHFVGMLSFSMPGMTMGYDIPLMALSVVIAIAASALALYVVSFRHVSNSTFVIASLVMGFAICGMHYTGMASMQMAAHIVWNYWLVALSYAIAVIASLGALKVCFQLRDESNPKRRKVQITGGILMGIAIAGMHYTGMIAATFFPSAAPETTSSVVVSSNLTNAVIGATALILGIAFATSAVERALARKTATAERNRDLYEQATIAVSELKEERLIRERFVSSLTHDLKTPLTAAKLNADLLARKLKHLEMADKKPLYRIVENIERAEEMIHNLLDAQRISVHTPLPLQPKDMDLVTLTNETIRNVQAVFGDRFHLQGPPSLPGRWDPSYLKRLIENLCTNAAKYGAPGEPVTVTLEDRGQQAEIRVHNVGNPIPPEEQKNLFGLFHRGTTAQKSGTIGWGIGLTLVKGVAESHQGSVFVKSTAEEGTTFFVRLPKNRDVD
jgi:NO-binding membrane sensor protein with MHYT domain